MARDRSFRNADPADDKVASGGTGFGIMAIIVAVERQWVTREQALQRLSRMLDVLGDRNLLPRRLSAFHQRRDRGDHSLLAKGRRR